jgi:hypothetical protein
MEASIGFRNSGLFSSSFGIRQADWTWPVFLSDYWSDHQSDYNWHTFCHTFPIAPSEWRKALLINNVLQGHSLH